MTVPELKESLSQAIAFLQNAGIGIGYTDQLNGMQLAQTGEATSFGQFDFAAIKNAQPAALAAMSAGQQILAAMVLLNGINDASITSLT